MKFSIIIPVYNSEKYLEKCVESVRKQSYQEWELLLIDDESQDRSPGMCDTWAAEDDRIRVIHKKNGGTAAARNTGLREMTGDYVGFMDNDDYWNDEYVLEHIAKYLKKSQADAILFDSMVYWEDKDTIETSGKYLARKEVMGQTKSVALRNIIQSGLMHRAVWAKMMKTSLVREHEIYFQEGMRNEDTDWTAQLFLCAKTYDWYETPFYVYRKGTGMAQTSKKNTYQIMLDLKNICMCYADEGKRIEENEFRHAFFAYLAYPYSVWIWQAAECEDERIKRDIRDMKSYAFILRYHDDPAVRKVYAAYRILGYRLLGRILKLYFRLKK